MITQMSPYDRVRQQRTREQLIVTGIYFVIGAVTAELFLLVWGLDIRWALIPGAIGIGLIAIGNWRKR